MNIIETTQETWRDVPGLPGYEASDAGRVRSKLRPVHPTGWPMSPQILTGTVGPCGYPTTKIAAGGKRHHRVGTLVAAAFLGPLPPGMEVRRLNGNPNDSRLSNLAYGSPAEVDADFAARARRDEAAGEPTHCPQGHRYADSWTGNWGRRFCRPCKLARAKEEHRRTYRPLKPAEAPCVDCGAGVKQNPGPGARTTRCPDCKRAAQRENDRRSRAKRRTTPPSSTSAHNLDADPKRKG